MYIIGMEKDDKLEKFSKKVFIFLGKSIWFIFLLVLIDIFILK